MGQRLLFACVGIGAVGTAIAWACIGSGPPVERRSVRPATPPVTVAPPTEDEPAVDPEPEPEPGDLAPPLGRVRLDGGGPTGLHFGGGGHTGLPSTAATPTEIAFDVEMLDAVNHGLDLGVTKPTFVRRRELDAYAERVVLAWRAHASPPEWRGTDWTATLRRLDEPATREERVVAYGRYVELASRCGLAIGQSEGDNVVFSVDYEITVRPNGPAK